MDLPTLERYLAARPDAIRRGPVALILVEDDVEVASTLAHHLRLGFPCVLALAPEDIRLPEMHDARLQALRFDTRAPDAAPRALNLLMRSAPGGWCYWGYNAEYLFYPFSETRSVGELLAFHAEERREAMPTTVIDLYADDLERHPDAVDLGAAHLDAQGYFVPRPGAEAEAGGDARAPEMRGGLRWRFEAHVPEGRRSIRRIGLVRARKGRRMGPDERFVEAELNADGCPWHRNLTAAVCSFRAAKALRRNPGSRAVIDTFRWRFSEPFGWQSRQLMDLGLMEPGQWF